MEKSKQDVYNFALTVLAMANAAGDDVTSHAIEGALARPPKEFLPALKQVYDDLLLRLRQREFEYPADLAKQVETAIRQIAAAQRGRRFWFF